jgi:hypothetical protein
LHRLLSWMNGPISNRGYGAVPHAGLPVGCAGFEGLARGLETGAARIALQRRHDMARHRRVSTGFTFHLHQGVVDVCD